VKMGALWWPRERRGVTMGGHGSIRVPEGPRTAQQPASVEHLLAELVRSASCRSIRRKTEGHTLERGSFSTWSIASGVIAEHADALFFVRE